MDAVHHTERPQFWRVAQRCCIIAGSVDIAFFVLFLWLNSPILAWINVLSVLMYAGGYFAYKYRRNELGSLLIWGEVIGHSALGTLLIGWDSGFHYFLLMFVPILPVTSTRKRAIIMLLMLWGYYIGLYLMMQVLSPLQPVPSAALSMVNVFNFSVVFVMFSYLAFFYVKTIGRAQQQLKHAASRDPLTGLFNRRHMGDIVNSLMKRVEKHNHALSVALIDLDRFKMINDLQGHSTGDKILEDTAKLLENAIRPGDLVARWGGEEFLLLLPGTTVIQAREVAERIRKTIESYGWEQVIGDSLTVTASIGVAQLKSGETFNCAVKNADVALYKSKAAGRNLVMSYH